MVIGRITQQECNSFANVETPQRCHLSHGNGRIYRAAHQFELLINTPAVGNLIREGKTHQLPHVIQTGQQVGMLTFQQSYQQRVGEGRL